MFRSLIASIAAVVLCACGTKISDLQKPDVSRTIVLEKDYVTIRSDIKQLYGFRAGRYTLVGSNADGDFYLNEKPSSITLVGSDVDAYRPMEDLPPEVVSRNQYPRTLNDGGFCIKKSSGGITITYFYLDEPVGILLGVVAAIVVETARGNIQFMPHMSNPDLERAISLQLPMT
jgi:hypothetical protein